MELDYWILLFLSMTLLEGCRDDHNVEVQMKERKQTMEEIRTQHEDALMGTPGVVGVGTGICKGGKECLKIYTSDPTNQVQTKLPKELKNIEVELEYVGDIKAQ